jgi:putative transposase
VIVDQDGGPTGLVIAGANVNDHKLLAATIEAIVIERPEPTAQEPQHLCLDKGYDYPAMRVVAQEHGYTPHIRSRGEEKKACRRGHKPRRWVVERTLGWLSKCRAILVRYDKHDFNYLGLTQLACALFWYRRKRRLEKQPVLDAAA